MSAEQQTGDPERGRELIALAGGLWRTAVAIAKAAGHAADFHDVIAARDEARGLR